METLIRFSSFVFCFTFHTHLLVVASYLGRFGESELKTSQVAFHLTLRDHKIDVRFVTLAWDFRSAVGCENMGRSRVDLPLIIRMHHFHFPIST